MPFVRKATLAALVERVQDDKEVLHHARQETHRWRQMSERDAKHLRQANDSLTKAQAGLLNQAGFAEQARRTAEKLEARCGPGPWKVMDMEKGSALAWRSIAERLDGTLHNGSAAW